MSIFGTGIDANTRNGELISRRIRSHAFPTAIAAGLLLYFGFAYGLSGVSGNALYDGSVSAFTWTLKIGGIVLAITAVSCATGMIWSMAVDGAASLVIGALLLATGGIWIVSGDMQGLLNVLFAMTFLYAGRGALVDFSWMRQRGKRECAQAYATEERQAAEPAPSTPNVGEDSALSTLVRRKRGDLSAPSVTENVSEPQPSAPPETPNDGASTEVLPATLPESANRIEGEPKVVPKATSPPPEGFLAALAKDGKPPKESS